MPGGGSVLCLLQGGHWVLRGHHPFTNIQQTFIEHLLGAGHCARFWVTAMNKTGKNPCPIELTFCWGDSQLTNK